MEIINTWPPNIEAIKKVFNLEGHNAVFAYGDKIYNPLKLDLQPHVIIHEQVHSVQQAAIGGPEAWWGKYLVDKDFRLVQEVEAYAKQYQFARKQINNEGAKRFLHEIASELSGSLYGNIVDYYEAHSLIRHKIKV
jgi:hypothetical protein